MNNTYKVSILVPVYGVEKYIAQCAESLFTQDYENIEFVFVNDCTKDKSIDCLLDVVSRFPNRKNQVKIINHQQNKGLAAARNTALDNSTGDFVLPFDSDDFLNDTSAVSTLMSEVYAKKADIVFYDLQNYPNAEPRVVFNIPLAPNLLTKEILKRQTYMSLCGGLYRKTLFVDNHIRSIENISMGEDYAIKPRLVYYSKVIAYVNQPYYCYRQENTDAITKKFKSSQIEDLRRCIDGFYEFFGSKADFNEYEDAIQIAEIRCKVLAVKSWAFFKGTKKDFKMINELFPKKPDSKKCLSKMECLLYLLSSYHLNNIIRLIYKFKCVFSN